MTDPVGNQTALVESYAIDCVTVLLTEANLLVPPVGLTPREWDCLRTLAQGYREAEVAEVTGITKSTVRYHLENVVQKLGCKNRVQALALAAQLGLLGPVGP